MAKGTGEEMTERRREEPSQGMIIAEMLDSHPPDHNNGNSTPMALSGSRAGQVITAQKGTEANQAPAANQDRMG